MKKIKTSDFESSYLRKLRYKTPFFLFSKKRIINKYKEYKKNFPKSDIYYAMKANFEPGVLKILSEVGSGFEVASAYELTMLKKLKVPAKKMIYGTSVKPIDHIKEFYKYGVRIFAFDSLQELDKIASVAPRSKVYVRSVVDDTGSVFRFSEKFGTDKSNIVPLLQRAKELKLQPYGISFHVGSQATNPNAWADALKAISGELKKLKKVGIHIKIINLGGGFPCNYATTEKISSLEEIAKITLNEFNKLSYKPKLILEPGRGIVATTSILITSVIGRVERKGNVWLFLDAGVFNSMFESMAYQGHTRYKISSLRPSFDAGEMFYAVAGPTGDSTDIITREALLPKDIEIGDKLIIHDVGAYSLVAASEFNGFPKPDVYIV